MAILKRTKEHHVDVLTQVRGDQTRQLKERHQKYVWELKKELGEFKREIEEVKAGDFLEREELKREVEDMVRKVPI